MNYKRILLRLLIPALTCLMLTIAVMPVFATNEKEEPMNPAPPMGFNTWYIYLDGFTEQTIKDVVTALDRKGLKDLGYQYIQIDWGWCAGDRGYDVRNEAGHMVPDPRKFTSMNTLANYLHRRGFKIGYYTDLGYEGCGKGIGSYGHYQEDIAQFLSWDADFIKIDSCGGHVDYANHDEAYRAVLDCIIEAKPERPVSICICCGGGYGVTEFISDMADDYVGDTIPFIYYRTAHDVSASIPTVIWEDETYGVLRSFDKAMAFPENSRPGCYFDLDALMLENNGLTAVENQAYYTMWAIAPSAMWLAVDVPNMKDETLELISNPEVIAVNQDPLCNAARLVREDTAGLQVYSKVQTDDNGRKTRAVMLLNRSDSTADIAVSWSDIGLNGACTVRDLWKRTDVDQNSDGYTASVPSHGVVLLKVTETAVTGTTEGTESLTDVTTDTTADATDDITGEKEHPKGSAPIGIIAAVVGAVAVIGGAIALLLKKKCKS